MSSFVGGSLRLWLGTFAIAIIFGALAGALSGAFTLMPEVQHVQQLGNRLIHQSSSTSTASTKPVEIIPVEPSTSAYTGLPTALRVGRVSPSLAVFHIDSRTMGRVFLSDRLTNAVALTNDGWLVTTDAAWPATLHLAEVGIGWQGKLLTPTAGLRDRATGLVFLKVNARDLPAAALVPHVDVEMGQSVWTERLTDEYLPSSITSLGFASTSSLPLSSDQWNRRYLLNERAFQATAAVWDARGQLVGLAMPAGLGAVVLPADAIRGALNSLLSTGDIRRPTLGVRYLDLGQSFTRVSDAGDLRMGALITGDKNGVAVAPTGAAAHGLRDGDIIERMDQDILDGTWTLAEHVLEYRPGSTVTFAGQRQGKPFEARIIFGSATTSEPLR